MEALEPPSAEAMGALLQRFSEVHPVVKTGG
jgi:hypothetical protein